MPSEHMVKPAEVVQPSSRCMGLARAKVWTWRNLTCTRPLAAANTARVAKRVEIFGDMSKDLLLDNERYLSSISMYV